jgi:LDH2 family malate/lactate/ureidoglycolate dehydrogenase
MDTLIRDIRNSQRLPNVDRIRLPGEGTHSARADRGNNGVPMPDALLAALDQLAGELKIAKIAR